MSMRVWILGAGFSRPLGGPLLNELMRPEVRNHLEASYPRKVFKRMDDLFHEIVLHLYAYGSRFKEGTPPGVPAQAGELIWTDAEQFLDYLDTAASKGENSPAFHRLNSILNEIRYTSWGKSIPAHPSSVLKLSQAAKRLIAGSCSAFLAGADPSTERWEPFLKWARQLGSEDTVITFNYDCVPEVLNKQTKTISVVPLGQGSYVFPNARLLKLHGSVNWKIEGFVPDGQGIPTGQEPIQAVPQPDFDFALKCEDHELAIASPGPMKQAVSAGWFGELWDTAERAIREASAITFIGFRFPPSDSHARGRLLGAIARNDSPYLAVHTVLGPNSPDASRLRQLLRFSLSDRVPNPVGQRPNTNPLSRSYTLIDHPLYGEDFLSVFPMGWITQAWQVQTP